MRPASQQEPSYRVRGILTDGSIAPSRACGAVPWARLGIAAPSINKAPRKTDGDRVSVSRPCAPVPHPLVPGATAEGPAGVCAGPEIRRFAGPRSPPWLGARRQRVRHWFQEKKAGWYRCLKTPRIQCHTLLDQPITPSTGNFRFPRI